MSDSPVVGPREGNLAAPTRHPVPWRTAAFYDEAALLQELERVFDICHGCRRCFSLCQAFPTLFDAVDASDSGEVDGVPKRVYWQVVDHCYLCDLCFRTKCPYVPPHPWNLDFPHLMLRAKAIKHRAGRTRVRDRILSATDTVGAIAGIPVVAELVNAVNVSRAGRALLSRVLGVHPDAALPPYAGTSFRRREARRVKRALVPLPTPSTTGKVVLYATCYCNHNEPAIATDLARVFEHNGIVVTTLDAEHCCGMPKLELGDLDAVAALKAANIPALAAAVAAGCDIVAPVPSCVLMYKQELPLLFPDDAEVRAVAARTFDPFEYLWLRHQAGRLRTDFVATLGKIAYQVPCHLRVQNIGLKTRDVLALVPGTTLEVIERCSGHDGTYAVKQEFHADAMRIGQPVVRRVEAAGAAEHASDCPMAGRQISHGMAVPRPPSHPLTLLRRAYGLPDE